MLHGLGYLPCYSYYSQTIGPSDWWLSTNDWAGYASSRWKASKTLVFTLGGRWEMEQLSPAITRLKNPDLPLTQSLPRLGSQWGPRLGVAWGAAESHWPVLRLGYGMYFSRTPNAQLETALTQTGSINGDLSFFMRPTDNLRGGGAPPFPYVLAGQPGAVVRPDAVEYASSFRNGEVHEAEVSLQESLPGHVRLEASGVASLGRRLPVTTDANIDPAANPKSITYQVVDGDGSGPIKVPQITVPFFASWPSANAASGFAGRLNPNYQKVLEVVSGANSTYEALLLRLSRNARGLTFRARYTLGHAADWNPDDSPMVGGPSVLDPIDFRQEYGTSDLDVRHSLTSAVIVQPNWKLRGAPGAIANGWMMSGVGQLHSGLPYTMRTAGSLAKEFNLSGEPIVGLGTGMNGYGGDNRVYGIGRNTYRYPATWKADLRIAKRFDLGQMRQLELMAESFNLFNHQNVTQVETTGYAVEQGTMNGAMPRLSFVTGLKKGQTEFGKPLSVNATDVLRERQFQFGARVRF
ncbi:TonB-dependent receptor [Occallatibacter savannae]|uniref:TonB-dependent receptor n=1 Tax=Occallatibacter savannae TaxID=1002691 RepID=UPI000D68E74F|nr:TonB-dependent receptor [Occallatibacter savannae]